MTRRYPLEPLLELTGWSLAELTKHVPCNGPEYRARKERGITETHAERAAVAACLHPFSIWPEMVDHAIEDASKPCADCRAMFIPSRAGHKFCSHLCRNRWHARTRYQTDPIRAAAEKARMRAFYAETADYKRAQMRRYYAENRERIRAAQQAARAAKREAA